MNISFVNTNKLKEFVLSRLTQEEIFAYYLNCSIVEIQQCLQDKNEKILNTVRYEENPSLSFMYKKKKLYAKDWGDDTYSGDCFHMAARKLQFNINDKTGFTSTLWHIINNMIYNNRNTIENTVIEEYVEVQDYEPNYAKKHINRIVIEERDFERLDLNYFYQYGFQYNDLIEGNIKCVLNAYYNGHKLYSYSKLDPCYAYFLGVEPNTKIKLYQLYYPNRPHKDRFKGNNIYPFQYPHELSTGLALVITKSRKDCLLLRSILKRLGYPMIHVISISSEGANIPSALDAYLKTTYNHIFTFYDFDKAGKRAAFKLKKEYGYIPLFLTNGKMNTTDYKAKDISDYSKYFSIDKAITLVSTTIHTYEHLII